MTSSSQNLAIIVLLVFLIVLLGLSVLRLSSVETVLREGVVVLTGPAGERVTIAVEIADDPGERQAGLMFRSALPAGAGMLFVFPDDAERSFWMKNTLIPLDILFFDPAGRFVSRATMEPCDADPCPTTLSLGAARYALEVNRGEARTAAVGEGWFLEMDNGQWIMDND